MEYKKKRSVVDEYDLQALDFWGGDPVSSPFFDDDLLGRLRQAKSM